MDHIWAATSTTVIRGQPHCSPFSWPTPPTHLLAQPPSCRHSRWSWTRAYQRDVHNDDSNTDSSLEVLLTDVNWGRTPRLVLYDTMLHGGENIHIVTGRWLQTALRFMSQLYIYYIFLMKHIYNVWIIWAATSTTEIRGQPHCSPFSCASFRQLTF